jgi:hypothetical protein
VVFEGDWVDRCCSHFSTIFGVLNKVAIDVNNVLFFTSFVVVKKVAIDESSVLFFGLFVVVEKDVIDGSCVLLCEVRLAADGRIAAWAVTP